MINVQFSNSGLHMSSRRFGSQSLVRLLGHWQQTTSRTPLWRQLADALRLLILDGRLALNTRLPGERELASALDVSRTTISSALAHLREEGYLESRHGSGSRVILPDSRAVPPSQRQAWHWIFPLPHSTPGRKSTRPIPTLSAITQHLSLTGYDQPDYWPCEAIAARYTARGLATRADEVMVVNGAVSAFALVLRMMTGPGDRVVVDHPTYPLAIAAIQGRSVGR
jgi:DNA-binding transcriptional MocR family regulator